MKTENLKKAVLEELQSMAKGESFRAIEIRSDGTFKLKRPYSAKKAKALLEKLNIEDKQRASN